MVSLLLRADSASLATMPAAVSSSVRALQGNAWWLIFGATIVGGLSRILRKVSTEPAAHKAAKPIMDLIRREFFPSKGVDSTQQLSSLSSSSHRVTLFRHYSNVLYSPLSALPSYWKWRQQREDWAKRDKTLKSLEPWDGWLIPVARSGHVTHYSSAIFPAPDNATLVEGIAGVAWTLERGQFAIVGELPDLSEWVSKKGVDLTLKQRKDYDGAIRDYAKQTKVPEIWVKDALERGQLPARSFAFWPLHLKDEVWVVVVDSSFPQPHAEDLSIETRDKVLKLSQSMLEEVLKAS